MEPVLTFVISQSILFPIIIGLIRFKTIKAEYLPFFLLLIIGVITEGISFLLIEKNTSNAIPTNIFVLIEWLLLTYQFYVWGFLKKKKRVFFLLFSFPILVWIVENLVFRKITL